MSCSVWSCRRLRRDSICLRRDTDRLNLPEWDEQLQYFWWKETICGDPESGLNMAAAAITVFIITAESWTCAYVQYLQTLVMANCRSTKWILVVTIDKLQTSWLSRGQGQWERETRGINSATNANIRFAKTGKLVVMVRTVTGRRPLNLGRAVVLPTLTTSPVCGCTLQ